MGDIATISDLGDVFSRIVSVLLAAGGVTLFVLILVSGFKYITSGGDPKGVESAQKTLSYAIGGFVLILVSYMILIIIENVAGLQKGSLTNFRVILTNSIGRSVR